MRRKLPLILVVIFFLGIGMYALSKTNGIVSGPILEITSPINGESVDNSIILVRGRADRISTLFLNGRKIYTDESGNFSENVLLSYGYNNITISANDKFGREIIKVLELVLN